MQKKRKHFIYLILYIYQLIQFIIYSFQCESRILRKKYAVYATFTDRKYKL